MRLAGVGMGIGMGMGMGMVEGLKGGGRVYERKVDLPQS